jgi:hypothetical protein
MSTIITRVSAVDAFSQETSNQYSQILNFAQMILTAMEQVTAYVEGEKEKLTKQNIQLYQLDDGLRIKIDNLTEWISISSDECDRCSDRYYDAEEYDDRSYWRERLDTAQQQYRRFNERYQYSVQIQKGIEQRKQQFQQLLYAFTQMIDALQKNTLEVKRILSLLSDEMLYNKNALAETLSRLERYCSAVPFGLTTSNISINPNAYAGSGTGATKISKKPKKYKFKRSELGFNQDGTRPAYRIYFSHTQPLKGMLYDLMKGIRHDLREAVMRELEGVIFLSAKHGFTYNTTSGGRKMRIIGLDVTDPSFHHIFLIHVGHQLYELGQTEEKLRMESCVSDEMARKSEIANKRLRQMAMDYSPVNSSVQKGKRTGVKFQSAGAEFFSECFKAYVADDKEFLNAAKENFGESYNVFNEIIARLPNR